MFRRVEDLEGGPGDPRDFDEWATGFRKTFKNVLLPLLIFVAAFFLIGGVGSVILQAIRG